MIEGKDSIDFNQFNTEFDEYGCPGSEVWVNFSIRNCNGRIEATSYIEVDFPGTGKGKQALEILEFMLQRKAKEIGQPIIHLACNMYENPRLDVLFIRNDYVCLGKNIQNQYEYEKVFYPA